MRFPQTLADVTDSFSYDVMEKHLWLVLHSISPDLRLMSGKWSYHRLWFGKMKSSQRGRFVVSFYCRLKSALVPSGFYRQLLQITYTCPCMFFPILSFSFLPRIIPMFGNIDNDANFIFWRYLSFWSSCRISAHICWECIIYIHVYTYLCV